MPPPVPERVAAKAAGQRFYETGKPCQNGHVEKRYTATGQCVICAGNNQKRHTSKKPWHPARLAAEAAGLKRYSTDRPCKNGHVAERYVCSGQCVVCVVKNQRLYHGRRPGIGASWARDRRRKNPEPHRAQVLRWIAKNPEKHREYHQRTFDRDPAKWRARAVVNMQNRKAREAANGGSVTSDQIEELRHKQNGRCAECGKHRKLEIDHIVPVSRGGSGDINNIQLLCGTCNKKKSAIDPIQWARRNGRLL